MSESKKCPKCGLVQDRYAVWCNACRAVLVEPITKKEHHVALGPTTCPTCSREISLNARSCPGCGEIKFYMNIGYSRPCTKCSGSGKKAGWFWTSKCAKCEGNGLEGGIDSCDLRTYKTTAEYVAYWYPGREGKKFVTGFGPYTEKEAEERR